MARMMRNTTYLWLLVSLIFQLALAPASADVEIRGDGTGHCDITLSATIVSADAVSLETSDCRRANIYIHSSPGGDAYAGMAIGRWARALNASIAVVTDAQCLSSCALAFIGGVHRSNFGEIGVHRPYLSGEPRAEGEIRDAVTRMNADIREYVSNLGVSAEFASVVVNTPPSEMRIYRRNEIYALVPATDPTYDEVDVATNARRYGITTDEYRRRHVEAEQACTAIQLGYPRVMSLNSPELAAYSTARHECKQAIYWGLSQSVYRSRYSEAVERCNVGDPAPEEVQECGVRIMQGLR